ncbi:MAG: flagellar hook-associated family protein [Pseudomonadota bacterium]
MKTTFVSTLSLTQVHRQTIGEAQQDLIRAQRELASGRYHDLGLELGYEIQRSVSMRGEIERLETFAATSQSVSTRLEVSELALSGLVEGAEEFLATLLATNQGGERDTAVEAAKSAISAAEDLLRSSTGGAYVFSGIDVNTPPLGSYYDNPTSVPKQQIDNEFLTAFGVSQTDPGVSGITAVQMQTFLDNDFTAEFDLANWQANWSQASSENMTSRISSSTTIQTSANANDVAVRSLFEAYTMVADLGAEGLSADTYAVVFDRAVSKLGDAIFGINDMRTSIGISQERVKDANERAELQKSVFEQNLSELEGVDPYEVSTRINELTSQLETSYALTARLQRLSLLDFL